MGYKQRALDALEELSEIPSSRPSDTDEGALEKTARWLLANTRFEWEKINSALFPDGNPLNLDLNDPVVMQQWVDLRTDQLGIAKGWVKEWDPTITSKNGYLTFTHPGLECQVSESDMRQRDDRIVTPAALWDLIDKHLPGIFPHAGPDTDVRTYPVNPESDPVRWADSPSIVWAQQHLRSTVANVGLSAGTLTRPERLTVSEVQRGLTMIAQQDWSKIVKDAKATRAVFIRNATIAAPPKDSTAPLVGFVEKRLKAVQDQLDVSTAADQFKAFGILEHRAAKAKAGRSWGIELEIIDAGSIVYDADGGWKRERDGSLRPQIGDGKVYDPWEFISPVLKHTFNQGLWMICDQAQRTVKYHKAGVHVHVSASMLDTKVYDKAKRRQKTVKGRRMTRQEVSRLLEIYAAFTPLTNQIINRTKTREFCVPTRVDQWVVGWHDRPASKDPRKAMRRAHALDQIMPRHDDAVANAKVWAEITKGPNHDSQSTHWKRHQEINLQALNKYGTIEFRSMGPVYDYEHLLKWAWMCRSMVDLAMSDFDLGKLTTVKDMTGLLTLLNQYSNEPLSKLTVAAA